MKRALFLLLTLAVIVSLSASAHAAITYSATGITPPDPTAWTANTDVWIGDSAAGGDGWVTVTPTSTLLSDDVHIGTQAGVSGAVTVDGTGAVWNVDNFIYVGDAGIGTLKVLNGGAVNSLSSIYAGELAGSNGEILIDASTVDTGSGGILGAGDYGDGSLTIQNGSTVTSYKGRVGYHGGAGTALVSNSTWTSSSDFYVGVASLGEMTIENGSTVSNTKARVGYNAGSGGSSVTITSSTWDCGDDVIVGYSVPGSVLIEDGGMLHTDDYLNLGYNTSGSGTITLTGAGSELSVSNYMNVGRNGPGVLNIGDGSLVTVGATLTIDVEGLTADSYINMSQGAMLSVNLGGDPLSLANLVNGNLDGLRWWNDSISGWDSINNATAGVDYTLVDVAGYGLLTIVPEPSALMLLVSMVCAVPVGRRR